MTDRCGDITVVIATCDRQESAARLVEELEACRPAPDAILVVDSSREVNRPLLRHDGVAYIRSSHRNQPYQRYLGALAAGTSLLIYLDDDLFVEDSRFLGRVVRTFDTRGVVGVGVAIEHESALQPVLGRPRGWLASKLVGLGKLARRLEPGEIDAVGNVGPAPTQDACVQYFPGAVMAFPTKVARRLFDSRLFALFQARLGMGEDKVISMRASRFGRLWWIATRCLRHPPDQGSHYAADPTAFLTKVLVSRLLLAQVYCEVFGRPRAYAWYAFGAQVIRTLAGAVLRERLQRIEVGPAVAHSLRIIGRTRLHPHRLAPGVDFEADARRDLARAGVSMGTP